ncbi:MAG: peptidoglycan DD-metalloendopeptidase family protein [Deltaproteobacteria bacterium]|nr:MAG: peptidoglycan DD-metalloendopeptidase family protein [Deltaproteobacteria bacterium]
MKPKIKVFLPFSPALFLVIFNLVFTDLSGAEQRSSIEVTRSQIQQTEKYLSEQQSELLNVDIKQKDILGEIERLEKAAAINRESLRGLSNQIQGISGEIQGGQRRILQLNQSSIAVKECLKKRLAAFYKFGRPGYARLLATSATVQEFQKILKYIKAIMDQDRQVLDMLGRQRSQVENELAMLKENMAKIEALKKAEARRMAELEKCIEKGVFLLMRVHREKEFYAKAVKELKDATQAVNQTMMDLEMEEKGGPLPGGFAEMRGKLPLPLNGEIIGGVERFGSNPFVHRKGIYIKGSPGEAIRSVFPGRVDYSGWFKGYGQLIIINHGSRYFTVYAHLEERIKEKGEMVSGGEVVGLVGDSSWHVGPAGVYFEIRKGRDYLDPKRWLE